MQDGLNAFDICAVSGHLAIAKYLAPKMEGHLFDSDDDGYTALHFAAQEGQLSMVKYLVKSCGFDVKAIDKVGLHYCCLPDTFSALSGHTCCIGAVHTWTLVLKLCKPKSHYYFVYYDLILCR